MVPAGLASCCLSLFVILFCCCLPTTAESVLQQSESYISAFRGRSAVADRLAELIGAEEPLQAADLETLASEVRCGIVLLVTTMPVLWQCMLLHIAWPVTAVTSSHITSLTAARHTAGCRRPCTLQGSSKQQGTAPSARTLFYQGVSDRRKDAILSICPHPTLSHTKLSAYSCLSITWCGVTLLCCAVPLLSHRRVCAAGNPSSAKYHLAVSELVSAYSAGEARVLDHRAVEQACAAIMACQVCCAAAAAGSHGSGAIHQQ